MLLESQNRLYSMNSEISGFSGILYRASKLDDDEILAPYANRYFSGALRGDTYEMGVALTQTRTRHMSRKRNAMLQYVRDLSMALHLISMTSTRSARHEFRLKALENYLAAESDKASTSVCAIEHIRTRHWKSYATHMRTVEKKLQDAKNVSLTQMDYAVPDIEGSLFIQSENVLNSAMNIAHLNMVGAEQHAGYVGACWFIRQPLRPDQRETQLDTASESEYYARQNIISSAKLLDHLKHYAQSERGCHIH